MARIIKGMKVMLAGLFIFLIGAILIVCTFAVFTHTRQELVQTPMSEVVIDSAFDISQLEDKLVQFQTSIGQTLHINAEGNGNLSFSIANFTNPNGVIQPDQPDLTYFSQSDTTAINTTWNPQSRVSDPGQYYLVFLARDALPDSPVQVYTNITKTWTDIQLKDVIVEGRIPLLDQPFGYLGSALAVLGTLMFSVTLSRNRRNRNDR